MPHGAGLYFYTPGYWPPACVAQAANRRFVRQGAVVRVLVEDSPGSGRHCKRLRMGGSAAMPGYKTWRGKWVRCAEQALEPTRTLTTDEPTGQRQRTKPRSLIEDSWAGFQHHTVRDHE